MARSSARTRIGWLVGLVVAVLGVVVFRYVLSSAGAGGRPSTPPNRGPGDPLGPSRMSSEVELPPSPARQRTDLRAEGDGSGSESEEPLIPPRLRAHAEMGLRAGWKKERADEMSDEDLARGMSQWERMVLDGPVGIGVALAKARTKAEEALADEARGGLFGVLEKLDAGGSAPLVELVSDGVRFDRLFFPGTAGEGVDGVEHREHPDRALEDGGTLVFPPGVFGVENLMREKDPFPKDVTIRGAGIDSTMLVLDGVLMTRGELVNFTVRDCTVHTNGNYLFDLRLKPASMTFERVRFVGFDMGAGSSCLLGTRNLGVRARDCRFEGGYGRTPWSGQLLDVRTDALLGRFERCRFSLIWLRLDLIRPGAALGFFGCSFEEMLDPLHYDVDPHPGVVFYGCSITHFLDTPGRDWNSVPRLDLNALFPNWQQRMAR